MNEQDLRELLSELTSLSGEREWVEFKHNFHSPDEIGKTLSALSNSASLQNREYGYMVFGIEDETLNVLGTDFKPKNHKKGNEDLIHWLAQRLSPRVDFEAFEFHNSEDKAIALFRVPATRNQPVSFFHQAYVRINSINRLLSEFPEKERKIWQRNSEPFEKRIACDNLSAQEVVNLLSTETYFDLLKIPYPTEQSKVLDRFIEEGLVRKTRKYAITNLGALLLGKELKRFGSVSRKSVRVIVYKGKNKVETEREQHGIRGYAVGFVGLIDWINSQLPANEEIGRALREDSKMYPEIAVRELVANALIHQDLDVAGFPMIEIFADRIEISNPGQPLVATDRFIDSYQSRNEKLADIMRRMGFCEEKGSGWDKVIFNNELYQLPPINAQVTETRTTISMYSYKTLNELGKDEKMWACYQHACLKHVSNDKMTNQSLRERFSIEDRNYSIASRIIRDTIEKGLVKEDDPSNKSRKYASYVPHWA